MENKCLNVSTDAPPGPVPGRGVAGRGSEGPDGTPLGAYPGYVAERGTVCVRARRYSWLHSGTFSYFKKNPYYFFFKFLLLKIFSCFIQIYEHSNGIINLYLFNFYFVRIYEHSNLVVILYLFNFYFVRIYEHSNVIIHLYLFNFYFVRICEHSNVNFYLFFFIFTLYASMNILTALFIRPTYRRYDGTITFI